MEAKFQDLLKNIIPGFLILAGVLFISYISDIKFLLEIISKVISFPMELNLLFLPFILYILGYTNDLISSQLEFWLYEFILPRPSYYILNGNTKRYRLAIITDIKNKLGIDSCTTTFSKDEANIHFQKANEIKRYSDNLNEFYLSYIFSRNILNASFLVFIFSLLSLFSINNLTTIWVILSLFLIVVAFGHRWRQRAFYYTRKVFQSVLF